MNIEDELDQQCGMCGGLHVTSVVSLATTRDPCTCPCCQPWFVERGLQSLRAENARRVARHAAEGRKPFTEGVLRRGMPWHWFGKGENPGGDGWEGI